jgi:O-acetyl-ADP-ribose deacetylase (regulator of RNase III)
MKKQFDVGASKLVLLEGDITAQNVDAIVNAANARLAGGGGVDGAIHRAGGPVIAEECRRIIERIGRLETGSAVATSGGNLPARWVIHTVGPVYNDGKSGEAALLARAYRESLRCALSKGARSIAFPSISTGAYRYPIAEAATIAIETLATELEKLTEPVEVRLVLFGEQAFRVFAEAAERYFSQRG